MSKHSQKEQKIRVLVGVSGGIAAYKSADLVRRLVEREFDVRVVMTPAASQFITPMTMQAVSGNPVHMELFDEQSEAAMGHIELAKWADIILVAPATANTIAKIANGFSDNLLTTLIVASQAELVVAPAMNQQMWANPTTIANVAKLSELKANILGPDSGEQACGDIGAGRMMEPLDIAENIVSLCQNNSQFQDKKAYPLAGRKVVITAGPTVEPIDPVRYISNHSSGKMGYALATSARNMGAHVTLISGPVNLVHPQGVVVKPIQSASEMLSEVKNEINDCDVFIGCAAVADYTPITVAEQKIKKSSAHMDISLTKNPDIISWVAKQPNRPVVVGFAAESEKLKDYASQKLSRKKLDMICANNISNKELGFNSDNNEILILSKSGMEKHLPAASKSHIANSILEQVGQQFLID